MLYFPVSGELPLMNGASIISGMIENKGRGGGGMAGVR